MAESRADRAFREEVLAGTSVDGRDHPTRRAQAATDYYAQAADAADEGVAGAEAAVEKARGHLAGAEDALTTMRAQADQAHQVAERAARLAEATRAEYGPDPEQAAADAEHARAEAGAATGRGR